MSAEPSLASLYGSRPLAALRLAAFLGMIVLLVPAVLISRYLIPHRPHLVSNTFYRALMRVVGFKIRTHGVMATSDPVLFVANHTSYLDVPVLGALIPASFVAKADVARWPLIGPLATMQGTVFVERRSSQASGQKNFLRAHLANKRSLILFPEGTSTDGQRVLPFKSALFSIVEEKIDGVSLTVQPISVTCTGLDGLPITRGWRSYYSWYGDMTLIGHLWNAFSLGSFTMDVVFHPSVSPKDFPDRKALALYCQQQVANGVEQSLSGRFLTAPAATKHLAPPASP